MASMARPGLLYGRWLSGDDTEAWLRLRRLTDRRTTSFTHDKLMM